jgi:hypothetical protein
MRIMTSESFLPRQSTQNLTVLLWKFNVLNLLIISASYYLYTYIMLLLLYYCASCYDGSYCYGITMSYMYRVSLANTNICTHTCIYVNTCISHVYISLKRACTINEDIKILTIIFQWILYLIFFIVYLKHYVNFNFYLAVLFNTQVL